MLYNKMILQQPINYDLLSWVYAIISMLIIQLHNNTTEIIDLNFYNALIENVVNIELLIYDNMRVFVDYIKKFCY